MINIIIKENITGKIISKLNYSFKDNKGVDAFLKHETHKSGWIYKKVDEKTLVGIDETFKLTKILQMK